MIMKTKFISLLVVVMLTTTQCMAQRTITVNAENNDISNNLDLRAVATAFGESKDLQDFEQRLNNYDSQISNLDLNNDGEVDYLRVIERFENNVHVVVIQDVLDQNVYQDVATIIVGRNNNNRSYVQIIGDPYLFGDNYIIDPVFGYTPSIFSYFWSSVYQPWYSPYYWGYYPTYYRARRPFGVNVYLSNVNRFINTNYRYYYSNRWRNREAFNVYHQISRNDYANQYPDRAFNKRYNNIQNKNDFKTGNNIPSRQMNPNNESSRRSVNPGWNNSSSGVRTRNSYNNSSNNGIMRSGANQNDIYQRSVGGRSSYDNNRNSNVNRSTNSNNSLQNSGATRNENINNNQRTFPSVNRTPNTNNNTRVIRNENPPRTITRENYNARPTPSVRPAAPQNRQVERRVSEPSRNVRIENNKQNESKRR
jgi:hypothetical protein